MSANEFDLWIVKDVPRGDGSTPKSVDSRFLEQNLDHCPKLKTTSSSEPRRKHTRDRFEIYIIFLKSEGQEQDLQKKKKVASSMTTCWLPSLCRQCT